MIFRIIAEAESEIDVAADWYEAQQQGLSFRFLEEVQRAFGVILRQPQSFGRVTPRGSRKEYRQYILRHFSYSIIYEVEPPFLTVTAVSHHRRRPYYWRHRRAP